MSSAASEAENLREEALKFGIEAQQILAGTQTFNFKRPRSQENESLAGIETPNFKRPIWPKNETLAVTAGQEVISSDEAAMEECRKFLKRVQDRLAEAGDTHDTYTKLLDTVIAHANGKLRKSELYSKFCIGLIGHADLFSDFERSLNDGREETRREIEQFRVHIRRDFERKIDAVLGRYRSTARKMEEIQSSAPEAARGKIVGDDVDYIGRACHDQQGIRWRVMIDLVTNPRSVCHLVLPCLEKRQKVLHRVRAFVLDYFDQVSS